MKFIILCVTYMLLCANLSGCATYVAAQDAALVKSVQAANDNLVRGIEEGICAVPIGAVIRNSEFVPIAQAACLPAGGAQNPVQLFQQMAQPAVNLVPAYQENMNANNAPGSTSVTVVPVAPATHVQRTAPVPKVQKKAIIPQSQASPIAQPIALPIPVPNAQGNAPNAQGNAPNAPAFGTLTKNPNFPN